MLTIDSLKAYGADVASGLNRCMGMTDFYLRLVNKELEDGNFAALKNAVEAKNIQAAFEAAHALKGALGNLALTPLCDPVNQLTEMLRSAETMPDTGDLVPRIFQALDDLKAMAK